MALMAGLSGFSECVIFCTSYGSDIILCPCAALLRRLKQKQARRPATSRATTTPATIPPMAPPEMPELPLEPAESAAEVPVADERADEPVEVDELDTVERQAVEPLLTTLTTAVFMYVPLVSLIEPSKYHLPSSRFSASKYQY